MKEDTRPQPYSLRLDPETRAKLEAAAKAAGRSLNAEIAMRLEASLQAEETNLEFSSLEEKVIDVAKRAAQEAAQQRFDDVFQGIMEEIMKESEDKQKEYEGFFERMNALLGTTEKVSVFAKKHKSE